MERKFVEIKFRHLAGFKNFFLHHYNIFVKCPGLKRNFVTKNSSKSSRPGKKFWFTHLFPLGRWNLWRCGWKEKKGKKIETWHWPTKNGFEEADVWSFLLLVVLCARKRYLSPFGAIFFVRIKNPSIFPNDAKKEKERKSICTPRILQKCQGG